VRRTCCTYDDGAWLCLSWGWVEQILLACKKSKSHYLEEGTRLGLFPVRDEKFGITLLELGIARRTSWRRRDDVIHEGE